jgi:hypothetical protein
VTILAASIFLVIIGTSIWAADDAQERLVSGESLRDIGGPPLLILTACFLVWIIAFPYYLIKRSHSQRAN